MGRSEPRTGAGMSQGCPVPTRESVPAGPLTLMFIFILGTRNRPGKGAKLNVPRRFGNSGRRARSRAAVPERLPEGAQAAQWTQVSPPPAPRGAGGAAGLDCAQHAPPGDARLPPGAGTIGWTLQRRQSWFAALDEAVPDDFRATGRLCARLPGTWGRLSRVPAGGRRGLRC